MRTYQALLIGKNVRLMQSIPGMLVRVGFEVDVIASRPLPIWPSKSVRVHYVPGASALLPAALAAIQKPYDLVIPADDATVGLIVGAAIPDALKLKLLPVCGVEHFSHLYSKIGLAKAASVDRVARDLVDRVLWGAAGIVVLLIGGLALVRRVPQRRAD